MKQNENWIYLFILLSGLDVLLTWMISNKAGTLAVEGNPIALLVLEQTGWLGMIAFKAVGIGIICSLSNRLYELSPKIASRVWMFSCFTMLLVVFWSCGLYAWQCRVMN